MKIGHVIIGLAALAAAAAVWPVAKGNGGSQDACAVQFFAGKAPAVDNDRSRSGRIICFSGYAVFHSGITKTAIWSAEHLTAARIAAARPIKRKNAFHAEKLIPEAERADLRDYARSGYDRGHMAPSGDMPDERSQYESFSLANMIPQHPCNNEELWEGIESAVRDFAAERGDLFVVTGPIFPRGTRFLQIGEGVLVPPQIFKAIYDPSSGQAGAYVTNNADGMDWRAASMDWIRQATGVDPFPGLSPPVKAATMQLPTPSMPRFKCRIR